MLDKSINSGKEKRKQYRGSKLVDRSCRNHGSCEYCKRNRLYNSNKRKEQIKYEENLDSYKDDINSSDFAQKFAMELQEIKRISPHYFETVKNIILKCLDKDEQFIETAQEDAENYVKGVAKANPDLSVCVLNLLETAYIAGRNRINKKIIPELMICAQQGYVQAAPDDIVIKQMTEIIENSN